VPSFTFHDVSVGARPDGAFGIEHFIVSGEHQGHRLRFELREAPNQFEATHTGQRHVYDDNIRRTLGQLGQGVLSIQRLAHNEEIRLRIERHPESSEDQWMIIHHIDPF